MKNAMTVDTIPTSGVEHDFMSMFRKSLLGVFTVLFVITGMLNGNEAFADNKDPAEQQKAREFIEAFSVRAIGVLNNKDLTDEQQFGEYRSILNEAFAIDYIARISLSRHRNKATEEELSEYYKLFPEFILKVNSARLKKLDTTRIEVDAVTPHAKSDIFIRTKAFNAENRGLDVDWRVRADSNGKIKIIDVKIEGISLVATQRDDFTSRISSSGVAGLNKYMRDIIDGIVFAEETAS